MAQYSLVDNEASHQYEFHIDRLVPRIEYIKTRYKKSLTHTEVPVALEGKGHGFALVKAVLEEVERWQLLRVPLCPLSLPV